jgi:FtsZ-interacting cell division protein ZipA
MIELNSVVVILMVEALAALLLLVIGLWLWSRKKKSGDFHMAQTLIDDLDEAKELRTENLGKLIAAHCALAPNELQTLLKEIDRREKALYQQIIQLFLNHDPNVLKDVDDYIQDLAQPYCAMLKAVGNNSPALEEAEHQADLENANQQIVQLTKKNTALAKQLQLALKTVDEVSDEYTQLFNGNKHELELRASYKRLLQAFQSIEAEIEKTQIPL